MLLNVAAKTAEKAIRGEREIVKPNTLPVKRAMGQTFYQWLKQFVRNKDEFIEHRVAHVPVRAKKNCLCF